MGGGSGLHKLTFILLVVGGLNWGLVGAFNWNIVDKLGSNLAMIVYILVGLSAIYEVVIHPKACRYCKPGM